MNDGFIKVCTAAAEIKVADCAFNARGIIASMKKAAGEGARLIAFPELSLTGYTCGDLFFQDALLSSALTELCGIMRETVGLGSVVLVGCPLIYGGKLYNTAVVLFEGRILGVVPKSIIPNYNEFYEKRHFESGAGICGEIKLFGEAVPFSPSLVFSCTNIAGLSFAVELCEDLWAAEPPSTALAKKGATVIFNLSASNEMIGKADYRRALVSGQSGRLICGYVYANAGEGESTTDMVFSGHSLIAENGTILAETRLFENESIISEIDIKKLSFERRKNTSFPAADTEAIGFELTQEETTLTRFVSKTPFIPYGKDDRDERCEAILLMQSSGLKKRIKHTNAKTAVIGISGGLDSSLALIVAAKAMDLLNRPRTDIIAVTMPCFGTTSRTKSNAERLCERLGVSFREIDITASVKQHFADINHDMANKNVVFENGQARERTKVLMDIANAENGLVIGTGDLSELALGWATYNGDHMSMYGVNASVPKTLIRHIIKYYSDTAENGRLSAVLDGILATPVSPELLPAENDEIVQKTEDLVGPYELHDFFLYYAIRFGFSPKKVFRLAKYAFEGDYSDEIILKWLKTFYRRFFNQQFKRSCLPDSPKIGSVTLSPRADWRMPSDASSAVWLEELSTL